MNELKPPGVKGHTEHSIIKDIYLDIGNSYRIFSIYVPGDYEHPLVPKKIGTFPLKGDRELLNNNKQTPNKHQLSIKQMQLFRICLSHDSKQII